MPLPSLILSVSPRLLSSVSTRPPAPPTSPTRFLVLNTADLAINRASIRFQDLVPTGVSLFEEDEILVLEFDGELPLGEVTRHPRVTRGCERGSDIPPTGLIEGEHGQVSREPSRAGFCSTRTSPYPLPSLAGRHPSS
ncbi:hypothetical protein E2562_013700 [Oryza meyeriana var. granulata]|uniref:Uncharacterized protein n=1 Tax=Oryza meyeriana var. granulata TaxID=110450 RepID=A0A6G1BJX9_9ORYZ|nr:hypothetical protein E2562_013700 [Oryza meyeriana var. granulata]